LIKSRPAITEKSQVDDYATGHMKMHFEENVANEMELMIRKVRFEEGNSRWKVV
jgi:hypothetical protein